MSNCHSYCGASKFPAELSALAPERTSTYWKRALVSRYLLRARSAELRMAAAHRTSPKQHDGQRRTTGLTVFITGMGNHALDRAGAVPGTAATADALSANIPDPTHRLVGGHSFRVVASLAMVAQLVVAGLRLCRVNYCFGYYL